MNLPSEIIPTALKKSTCPPSKLMGAPGSDRPPRGPPKEGNERHQFGDKKGYRSSNGFGGEKGGIPRNYRPNFRYGGGGGHGFGRGGGGGFNSGGSGGLGAITE